MWRLLQLKLENQGIACSQHVWSLWSARGSFSNIRDKILDDRVRMSQQLHCCNTVTFLLKKLEIILKDYQGHIKTEVLRQKTHKPMSISVSPKPCLDAHLRLCEPQYWATIRLPTAPVFPPSDQLSLRAGSQERFCASHRWGSCRRMLVASLPTREHCRPQTFCHRYGFSNIESVLSSSYLFSFFW